MANETFLRSSMVERYALQHILPTIKARIIETTPIESYDQHDGLLEIGGVAHIVELKVRNFDIQYSNNWIIEKEKYDYLLKESKRRGMPALYINIHSNGVQIWNLNKIEVPEWNATSLPKKSANNQDYLIEKISGYLNSEEAKVYTCGIPIEQFKLKSFHDLRTLKKKYEDNN